MIHYHGLPITPDMTMLAALKARHAMVSFAHPQQIELAAEICQSITLDNGTFSAWRQGRQFNADGYHEWAAVWLKHPAVEWCLIPDVIDGTEGENNILLNAWQLPSAISVPVWHLHESLERLDRLVHSYPRVAFGSSGQYAEPGTMLWWGRMSEAMQVACDADGLPHCKLHGLRMLDPVLFSHLPFSSADSTNVARNIGLDERWRGTYVPKSKSVRALILIERIESHASAARWCGESAGVQQKMDLFG